MSKTLSWLFIAAFFNALLWIVLIPVWQYPDEQAHFAQLQNIAEFGLSTPNLFKNTSQEISLSEAILETERDSFGNNKFTYHPEYKLVYSNGLYGPDENTIRQLPSSTRKDLVKWEATVNPPLYYILGASAYRVLYSFSLFEKVYAARFISLFLFTITIFIAYKIAKIIFEKNNYLKIALPATLAFMPMFVFASTGVLPDPLTNLLFTLIIYFCLRIINFGLSPVSIFVLILVMVLGTFTRQQFLISLPIILLAPAIYFLGQKQFKKLLTLILFLIVGFIIFSQKTLIPEIGYLKSSLSTTQGFFYYFIWTVRHSIYEVLPWYWGVYKWLSLTVPHINYQVINRVIIIALIGILIKFFLAIKNRKFTALDTNLIFLIAISLIYFLIFALWDFLFSKRSGFSFGIQGRYFFPLIVAHMSILLIGLWQVFETFLRGFAKYGIFVLIVSVIIFNAISLAFVSASYYSTVSLSTFVSQASQYKPIFFKGNIILTLIAFTFLSQGLFIFKLLRLIIRK